MILLRKFRQRLVAIRRMLGLSAVLREGAACREGGRMSAPAGRLAVDKNRLDGAQVPGLFLHFFRERN